MGEQIENTERIKRLPPSAKRYLRLTAIAQLRTVPDQTRMRARSRALDTFNQMGDEETEQLIGFLSWRQDRVIGAMKQEIERRRSGRATISTS